MENVRVMKELVGAAHVHGAKKLVGAASAATDVTAETSR